MHYRLAFGPKFSISDKQYESLNMARKIAIIFSDKKAKKQEIRIYKYTKAKTKGMYYQNIAGKVTKVTDPDGLVVYLYQEVSQLISPNKRVFVDGPVYTVNADGSLGSRVSDKFWSDPYEGRY